MHKFTIYRRGQLGIGTLDTEERPVLIDALAGIKVRPKLNDKYFRAVIRPFLIQVIDIAAGGWHSAAISAFNDLYVWGWNVSGQLGLPLYKKVETAVNGDQIKQGMQKQATVFTSPVILNLPKCRNDGGEEENEELDRQYNPIEVFAGTRHTIIRTVDGTVLGAGWNKYGQLATETRTKDEQDKFLRLKSISSTLNDDYRIVCGEWSSMYFSVK